MESQKEDKDKAPIKSKADKKKKEEIPEKEEEGEERNGIIPEGMDFKKFMGCGG